MFLKEMILEQLLQFGCFTSILLLLADIFAGDAAGVVMVDENYRKNLSIMTKYYSEIKLKALLSLKS